MPETCPPASVNGSRGQWRDLPGEPAPVGLRAGGVEVGAQRRPQLREEQHPVRQPEEAVHLVRKQGGVAIGVYNPASREKWGRAWGFIEEDRVSNLVPADYGSKSALYHSLLMAMDAIATRIELRRSTYQG